MKLELTEAQQEAVILTILKRDLQTQKEHLVSVSSGVEDWRVVPIEDCKKNIKMLKRAINFYSVTDEY